jgi:hypothetical protein
MVDITSEVAAAVEASGCVEGTVTVLSKHSTVGVMLNEFEVRPVSESACSPAVVLGHATPQPASLLLVRSASSPTPGSGSLRLHRRRTRGCTTTWTFVQARPATRAATRRGVRCG